MEKVKKKRWWLLLLLAAIIAAAVFIIRGCRGRGPRRAKPVEKAVAAVVNTTVPTPMPQPTDTPAPTPMPEAVPAVWSDPDAFDARGTVYPLGDKTAWVYFQAWDGSNVASVIHGAVAPGLVIRIRGYVGTRWLIWNSLPSDRLQEMAQEVAKRDQLPDTPDVIIIESIDDPDISKLPPSWSVESFPAQ